MAIVRGGLSREGTRGEEAAFPTHMLGRSCSLYAASRWRTRGELEVLLSRDALWCFRGGRDWTRAYSPAR